MPPKSPINCLLHLLFAQYFNKQFIDYMNIGVHLNQIKFHYSGKILKYVLFILNTSGTFPASTGIFLKSFINGIKKIIAFSQYLEKIHWIIAFK